VTPRILLADDSPHAQRMGERILREEGFEVITVADGALALQRLADADPDLMLADVFLPEKSGYELCQYVKNHPKHRHVRVVLIAGLLEPIDESEAKKVGADAILKKPFEASAVLETIKPLADAAQYYRGLFAAELPANPVPETPASPGPARKAPNYDVERVRAAVTVALDRALPNMIREITEQVLIALGH
jgi:CheY-like chemotaxis protein